jgi:uncharacterized protein (TIGR00730 family)
VGYVRFLSLALRDKIKEMFQDLFFSPEERKSKETKKDEETLTCRLTTELLRPADQSWRLFSIMSEFVNGFNLLRKLGPAVTFWGSARFKPGEKYYKDAEELAAILADKGLAVVTGGGGGIMEAGNVGAFKVGGRSVGLNIRLPMEQRLNPYTTESLSFDHFFARKVMLAYASEAYIYFPGGLGTLDEFFEIATLVQTKKITAVPILLYGADFWHPLVSWMEKELLKNHKTIDQSDLSLFQVVDSVEEAEDYLTKHLSKVCNLRPTKKRLRKSLPPTKTIST